MKDFKIITVDQVGIGDRVSRITKRSVKNEAKIHGLRMALNMIDLTTLEGADTINKVKQLCYKGMHLHDAYPDLPTVAAICVYPNFVGLAKEQLKGSGINVASVATAFPSGNSSLEVKITDTKMAIDAGADEVDMVISRGKFHQGEYNYVFDEIAKIKETCGKNVRLKTILETGELGSLDNIRRASDIAMHAGSDFIKTSTGKETENATLPVSLVMVRMIREYFQRTGIYIGFKPAGGVSDSKTALLYMTMMQEELGRRWLEPDLFRFGASSLLGDIERQLDHYDSGYYSAAYRHAMA